MSKTPPPSLAPAAAFDGVRFTWPGGGFGLSVPSWRVAPGERICIVGPSGGGKTTLLSLLAGVVVPQEGSIDVMGRPMSALRGPARDRLRADAVGLIFQMFNLLPFASVIDNVRLPLAFSPARRDRVGPDAAGEARRLLAALGLDAEAVAATPAARLSVGQQQRVAAARALIGRPALIVADEPTSALDPGSRSAFLELLFAEAAAGGSAVVVVSHDAAVAGAFDVVTPLSGIAVPVAASNAAEASA